MFKLDDCNFIRLTQDTDIKPFDCGDEELNKFLPHISKKYLATLLGVTYLYEFGYDTVAFFCVSNDKISYEEQIIYDEQTPQTDKVFSNKEWNEFQKTFSDGKRLKGYPSVKIGRLGVNVKYKSTGIGTDLLDKIKMSFLFNNKTGCKFITVDAYNKPEVLAYYSKNGFDTLTDKDMYLKTRLMYFDLARFKTYQSSN